MPKILETISLSSTQREVLLTISKKRTETISRIQRAKMLLMLSEDCNLTQTAKKLECSVKAVYNTHQRFQESNGKIEAALNDRYRKGRPSNRNLEQKLTVMGVYCQKPKDLGYASEIWTQSALAEYIRNTYPEDKAMNKISKSSISRLASTHRIKAHRIRSYKGKKDPEFDQKKDIVMNVFLEVQKSLSEKVTVSVDEKPGIQALQNVALDKMPKVQAQVQTQTQAQTQVQTQVQTQAKTKAKAKAKKQKLNSFILRNPDYTRLGTISLLAGTNLSTGEIYSHVSDTHKSSDFKMLLKAMDLKIDADKTIRLLLDNVSTHNSKETTKYINHRNAFGLGEKARAKVLSLDDKKLVYSLRSWKAEMPFPRFECVFLPKYASWLNPIEGVFSVMSKTFLRHIRVDSKTELCERIHKGIKEMNQNPKPRNQSESIENYFYNRKIKLLE
jgi:transposase